MNSLPPDDLDIIQRQLSRQPHGFQEVVRRNRMGEPAVIRVASIVEGRPFPTLFWLSDPRLSQLIYDYESRGVTTEIQKQIDLDPEFQSQMIEDNQNHIHLRESYYNRSIVQQLEQMGITDSFRQKGIGGNANFLRVRCLHAYLAAHVVSPNVVGHLLETAMDEADPLIHSLNQLQ